MRGRTGALYPGESPEGPPRPPPRYVRPAGRRRPGPELRLTRLVVVTNPRSRQNRRDPHLPTRLTEALAGQGEIVQPMDLAEMARTAERLRDDAVDIVGIHGGDGTAHVVLTALARAYGDRPLPRIALLPGGTMNTIASGIGVRGAGPSVLARLVAALAAGTPVPSVTRNLLYVDGPEPQYGFLFGNGLISNYLEVYYEGAEPSPTKAILVLARGILSAFVNGAAFRRLMRTVEVECQVNGERWPSRAYLAVGAGTVDDIGFRFRPFFEALRQPGRIHALGIACPPLSFVFELPRIWLARPVAHPDIRSVTTTHLRMRSERPIAYMVDGDFCTGGVELDLRIGPPVELLLPA